MSQSRSRSSSSSSSSSSGSSGSSHSSSSSSSSSKGISEKFELSEELDLDLETSDNCEFDFSSNPYDVAILKSILKEYSEKWKEEKKKLNLWKDVKKGVFFKQAKSAAPKKISSLYTALLSRLATYEKENPKQCCTNCHAKLPSPTRTTPKKQSKRKTNNPYKKSSVDETEAFLDSIIENQSPNESTGNSDTLQWHKNKSCQTCQLDMSNVFKGTVCCNPLAHFKALKTDLKQLESKYQTAYNSFIETIEKLFTTVQRYNEKEKLRKRKLKKRKREKEAEKNNKKSKRSSTSFSIPPLSGQIPTDFLRQALDRELPDYHSSGTTTPMSISPTKMTSNKVLSIPTSQPTNSAGPVFKIMEALDMSYTGTMCSEPVAAILVKKAICLPLQRKQVEYVIKSLQSEAQLSQEPDALYSAIWYLEHIKENFLSF